MSFEIEKGVPIPQRPAGKKKKYPISEMEVGDSFAFTSEQMYGVMGAIRNAKPKKFSTRLIGDRLHRVWRIE